MAEFQFHGDISDLSVEQRELISNVFKEKGFKDVTIDVQPLGKAGDNFVANVKRITAEYNGETFKVIAKVAPKNEQMRALGKTDLMFQNEHIVYTEVLPKLTELEKAANIPEEERLKYATCYGSYIEAPNEIILLEDLEIPGYKMLDKLTSLTDKNVRLVLKDLAKLHSLSYALKYQHAETFEKLSKKIPNVWLLMGDAPEMTMFLESLESDVQLILDDVKYKKAVKNVVGGMLSNILELAKIDSTSKFSVIQQGDAWTNNIMFRLENNKAVECCMIDYQLSKVSSPVADLHYMIFNCTDHAMRLKHYHDWIDYYYSQLDKRLTQFDLKTGQVYPRYKLEADLKMFAEASLGLIIMVSCMVFRETAEAAIFMDKMNSSETNISLEDVLEDMKLSSVSSGTIQKFKARIEGVVDSFVHFGYKKFV